MKHIEKLIKLHADLLHDLGQAASNMQHLDQAQEFYTSANGTLLSILEELAREEGRREAL